MHAAAGGDGGKHDCGPTAADLAEELSDWVDNKPAAYAYCRPVRC